MSQQELFQEKAPVDRRDFLKKATGGFALGVYALVVTELLEFWTGSPQGKLVLANGVVLVDKKLCSGCRTCEAVCTSYNEGGMTSSSLARIFLEKDHIRNHYEAKTCFQCAQPLCLLACPVAALRVDRSSNTNARIIDKRACLGCRQCIEACAKAFEPPRPKYDRNRRISVKCHLCFGQPRCVEFCPYGALRYERSDIGLQTGYPVIKEK